jgi:hypothetical protein
MCPLWNHASELACLCEMSSFITALPPHLYHPSCSRQAGVPGAGVPLGRFGSGVTNIATSIFRACMSSHTCRSSGGRSASP